MAADQSMEDILASIRRILNEDEAPADPTQALGEPSDAPVDSGPLVLTEDMMVPADVPEAPPPSVPALPPPALPTVPEDVVEPPVAVAAAPAPALPLAPDDLIAPAVAAATAASVGRLLSAVSSERSAAVTRGGPSIEDVVREEIRPLLKDWLDRHLPGMVERLVRAEIERVVGRSLS